MASSRGLRPTAIGRVPKCRREHPMTGPGSIAAIQASNLTPQLEWPFFTILVKSVNGRFRF